MLAKKTLGIIGNPNVGKTYLFNRLTACSSCVGNWSGVTSTACQAKSSDGGAHLILDLPGCHRLQEHASKLGQSASQIEVNRTVSEGSVDLWLNVIDVNDLARQLYLTVQLLESKQNVIVVLNRIDLLPQLQREIDIKALGDFLGVPIVKVSAKLGLGIKALQSLIAEVKTQAISTAAYPVRYPQDIERWLNRVAGSEKNRFEAWGKLLAGDYENSPPAWHFDATIAQLLGVYHTMTDIMALTRHEAIGRWVKASVKNWPEKRTDTDKSIDQWALHPWLGVPIFFTLMFLVFWISMGCGQFLQSVFEPVLTLWFVNIPKAIIQQYGWPQYLDILVSQGIGLSMVTALSFFPVLSVMFMALNLLEESGYMTRAAIVMDRVMRYLDLPGESMVALILGLGCNVPGVLATRHIPEKSDKVVTALMMPFMSCGARLSIFAVFASVFFPDRAARVLFFLYTLGMGVALLTGWLAKMFDIAGKRRSETYLLEIPQYQIPSLRMAWRQAALRSRRFVWRALGVILPVCMVLAILNHISITGEVLLHPGDRSILADIGKYASVLFYPIGLESRHWPMVVSLIMGLLAKEVVISTLNIFYVQMELGSYGVTGSIATLCHNCWLEVLDHMGSGYAYFLPFSHIDTPTWLPYLNAEHIDPNAVMGYLIFTLLYFPCISTLYAQAKEVGWRWAGVSVLWSTVAAYIFSSSYWVFSGMSKGFWGMSTIFFGVYLGYWVKEWLIQRIKAREREQAQVSAV